MVLMINFFLFPGKKISSHPVISTTRKEEWLKVKGEDYLKIFKIHSTLQNLIISRIHPHMNRLKFVGISILKSSYHWYNGMIFNAYHICDNLLIADNSFFLGFWIYLFIFNIFINFDLISNCTFFLKKLLMNR